jgi:hypothetical protein
VPSGVIVISVITVGNAVQIKRSCLSSVYLNYLSRIPGHAASRCAEGPATLYSILIQLLTFETLSTVVLFI